MNAHRGLLLLAHGTRDARGRGEALQLAGVLAEMLPGVPVELGFLELCPPAIEEAVAALLARGVKRVSAMPLLLFAAGHAKRDIPQIVEQLQRKHAALQIDVASPFGCDPLILELSRLRFRQTRQPGEAPGPGETLLLLVGRGSDDPEANAALRRLGQLRAEAEGLGGVETCFCSLAEPTLAAGLQTCAQSAFSRVVVQPHLLFAGALLERVEKQLREFADRSRPERWRFAQHLGPHKLVAKAVIKKAGLATPEEL